MTRPHILHLVTLAGLVFALAGARAQTGELGLNAPCGAAPLPGYAELGTAPNVRSWSGGKASRSWVPQACTGWSTPGFDVLVAVAGSFRHEGEIDGLLPRIGAISSLKGIQYWSTTEKAWRPLVTDAYALTGTDPESKRPDFAAAQMAKGRELFYAQSDNRSTGKTVYRLRVLDLDRERAVLDVENVTPLRMMLMPLFGAGDLQSVYFLERRAAGVWGFYSLSRARAGSSLLSSGTEASYVNRAVAFYRHVAGIPTNQEPPAAR